MLFAKDGKLVRYPGGLREAHYDVPEGITVIGDAAFRRVEALESLSLLRVSGSGVFANYAGAN